MNPGKETREKFSLLRKLMVALIIVLKWMAFKRGCVFAKYFYSYVCQFPEFYRTFLYRWFAFGF